MAEWLKSSELRKKLIHLSLVAVAVLALSSPLALSAWNIHRDCSSYINSKGHNGQITSMYLRASCDVAGHQNEGIFMADRNRISLGLNSSLETHYLNYNSTLDRNTGVLANSLWIVATQDYPTCTAPYYYHC